MDKNVPQLKYWINKIQVQFPMVPYKNQISLMDSVLSALHNSKNCLIESPTGTGKTLALLCSSLAWLQYYKNNIAANQKSNNDANSDEDFEHSNSKNKKYDEKKEDKNTDEISFPRIIYCTRTHKQIDQVVQELKRTAYNDKNLKMCILSSRKLSCINEDVRNTSTINEKCRILTNKKTPYHEKCKYFLNLSRTDSYDKLMMNNIINAYSRNEFQDVCASEESCPYYSSQRLSEHADIIFAPYNYMLDPLIREQMSINIENTIVILDEAHNIEDICRDSLSDSFPYLILQNIFRELNTINSMIITSKEYASTKQAYHTVSGFVATCCNWLKTHEDSLKQKSVTVFEKILTGQQCKDSFISFSSINPEQFKNTLSSFKHIESTYNQEEFDFLPKLSDHSSRTLSSLVILFNHILSQHSDCFTIAITKGEFTDFETTSSNFSQVGFDRNAANVEVKDTSDDIVLRFACLSPSLVFRPLADECRSVILASGTLAPVSSFEPELGVPFECNFQAMNHLKPEQAMIAALGVDMNNKSIRMTYGNIDALYLQDQIGDILYNLCQVIPKGLLCFFPSYKVLDKFTTRWQTTKLIAKMNKIKHFYTEARGMSSSDVETMLSDYYYHACTGSENSGAILFAVCRGRISEGMDFRDNRARAVITIGIPYSNIKVLEVEQKIAYNDATRATTKNSRILSGNNWYNIQAYRALNQALGRCIRHSEDWGAIIMIDERLSGTESNPISNTYLSKWIYKNLQPFSQYPQFIESIENFFHSKSHLLLELENTENYMPPNKLPPRKPVPTKRNTDKRSLGINRYFTKNKSDNNKNPKLDDKYSSID